MDLDESSLPELGLLLVSLPLEDGGGGQELIRTVKLAVDELGELIKGDDPIDIDAVVGDHNTRAHYGVRTGTQKLIYFWKKNQWEMYDLAKDRSEEHNLAKDHAQRIQQTNALLQKEVDKNDVFNLPLP